MEDFVAIDFETANENRGSACAVALVKFDRQGNEVDHFSTLLMPHDSINYFCPINTWIHGITEEDVADAPSWNDIYEKVIDFIGDLPIVAHNMAFDGYVLTDLDRLYGKEPLTNRRYCTVRLARKLFKEMEYRGLPEVFAHYFPEASFKHHEAESDARATGQIFVQMQKDLGINKIAVLCPPTGPGAVKERVKRYTYTDHSELIESFKTSESLRGHHVTFTGKLSIAPRDIMRSLVEELGGVNEKATTKKTTILVVGIPNPASWREGASASKKLEKATELRDAGSPITVMSETDFLNFLQDGQY